MAKVFETWTVLAHKPIEKIDDHVWTVEGSMPDPKIRRIMTIARMGDGRLIVHNAIALGPDEMAQIEAWGEMAMLVVPNGFHRQDAKIFKQRYPSIRVYCPARATKKVAEVVPVDGSYSDLPTDAHVSITHLAGTKDREGALQIRGSSGTTLVFNDIVMNQPKIGGIMGFALGPTGIPAVPRAMRWLVVSDKKALRADLLARADVQDLHRIVVSHGAPITEQPAEVLRTVAHQLD